MPSKRRRRSKNLGTNLAEVQRRLRYLERRPVRTKLQRNVVTTASIAVNAVTPDEVSFGTTVITDASTSTIENPKDGLLVINETAGTTSVYSEEQRDYIQLPAVDDDARTVANGKNTIYYQNNPPSGGTYAVDDTWFDSDDGYKMYTWTGTTWSGFQLGNSAIASISAEKITAGSLAAGVIVTSNLSAGQITTGSLSSAVIATTALNANNITAGIISGITVKTSGTQRRIEITDQDDMIFYDDTNTRMGTITSVNQDIVVPDPDRPENSLFVSDGILIYGGSATINQGTPQFPSIIASSGIAGIYGGVNYFEADQFSTAIRGPVSDNLADEINLNSGYGPYSGGGDPWSINIVGRLTLDSDQGFGWNGEPLSEGTGQPPSSGDLLFQVVFRYT